MGNGFSSLSEVVTGQWLIQDEEINYQFDAYASCNFQWFLKSSNVLLDVPTILGSVQHAMRHLHAYKDDPRTTLTTERFALQL